MTTYNTNLAAEFYVLSVLHRLGAEANLTLGNKKAVDIVVLRAFLTSDDERKEFFTSKGKALSQHKLPLANSEVD